VRQAPHDPVADRQTTLEHEEIAMKAFATVALASLMVAGAAADASAWTRQGSVNTWRGTYAYQGSAGCAAGTCSRSRSVTGPYGGTVSRSGSVTRTAPGQYSYSRTTTGPRGGSVTRSGSVSVTP
jgi:hypothetical protein